MHQHFRPLQLRADETRQSETSRQTIPYKRFSLPKRKKKFFLMLVAGSHFQKKSNWDRPLID